MSEKNKKSQRFQKIVCDSGNSRYIKSEMINKQEPVINGLKKMELGLLKF